MKRTYNFFHLCYSNHVWAKNSIFKITKFFILFNRENIYEELGWTCGKKEEELR